MYLTQAYGAKRATTACTTDDGSIVGCCVTHDGWVTIGRDDSIAQAEHDLARMLRQSHRKNRAHHYRIIEVA